MLGVPETPTFLAAALSASMAAAPFLALKASSNFALSTPACAAQSPNFSGSRAFMFSKAMSWNFQNASLPPSS